MTEETAEAPATTETSEKKKVKRLSRKIDGRVLTITEMETGESISIDADTLSAEIQSRSMMHGLNQKIGDAAAGKTGADAMKAMMVVAQGIVGGNWAVRAPASKNVSVSDINNALGTMSEEERAVLLESFTKAGVDLATLGIG